MAEKVDNAMRTASANAATSSPRTFWDYPLAQLTLVRIREFIREPEAVFWVFVFPILMAVALGIAFRSSAPDRVQVGLTGPASPALCRSTGVITRC